MQQLTWVSGSFSAHVLNARLRSEGIDSQLRGPVDGPYALTVGDLARVEVYVPADQMDAAELVALDAPEGAAGGAPLEHGHLEQFGRERLAVVLTEHRCAESYRVVD